MDKQIVAQNTMEYNLAIKKKEILTCAASWINRDNIKLTARSQIQKLTYCNASICMKYLQLVNPQRQKTDGWLPGAGRTGKERNCLMDTGSPVRKWKCFGTT